MSVLSETINEALHPESRPKPNLELLKRVLRQIDDYPNLWNQEMWRDTEWWCGTSYCFAGWAVKLSGGEWEKEDAHMYLVAVPEDGPAAMHAGYTTVAARAQRLLGLTASERYALFFGGNTRQDLEAVAGRIRLRAFEEFGDEDPDMDYGLPPLVIELAGCE